MAGVGDKWDIEKLDGTNWPAWKFQMEHLLEAKDLWEHVMGTAVNPVNDPAATAAHQKAIKKAMATLATGIHSSLVYLVTSCTTPKQIWDTLKAHFERDTLANKLFLKRQFFTMKMCDNQPVQDHLRGMKEITDKLAAIGSAVAEEEQVVALLISLSSSYSTLVTALEAKGDDLSLSFVQHALINEEQKRNAKSESVAGNSAQAPPDSALQANKPGFQKGQFRGKCFNCKKFGHRASQCRLPSKNSAGSELSSAQRTEWEHHKAKTVQEPTDEELFLVEDGMAAQECGKPWFMDSGASRHMTNDKTLLADYQEFENPETVRVGDGHVVNGYGTGSAKVTMELGNGKSQTRTVSEVLYVPKLVCNLFSVRAATKRGLIVQFGHTLVWIKDSKGKVVGKGKLVGRMYQLNCVGVHVANECTESKAVHEAKISSVDSCDLWHQRLGHLNKNQLTEAVRKGLITGVDISPGSDLSFCPGCVEGKMTRQPCSASGGIKSTRKLELVHSDVCEMPSESFGGKRYFLTFVDDYSRCVRVYFLKHKSEVFEKFKEFEASATNEASCRIGSLRTDNGTEYINHEFEKFLKEKGVKHETSVVYCPQQNGVAERINRTLVESARAMLFHAKLSKGYWAEAVNAVAYIRNRVVTSASGHTPYERWYGRPPDVSKFRVFGCAAYAHVPDCERRKLDKKAVKYRLVGYSSTQKGYRLVDPVTRKVVVRKDVVFDEGDLGNERQSLEIKCDDDEASEGEPHDARGEDQHVLRRSQRANKGMPPDRFGHVALHAKVDEHRNLPEALKSEYSEQWKAAADSEYQSLLENETWDLVPLPKGKNLVWLRQLLNDMGFTQDTTVLHGDNQSAITLSKNPVYHDRTKHIAVRYHYVRERVASGDVKLDYCPTKEMIADGLTKAQGNNMFESFVKAVCVM